MDYKIKIEIPLSELDYAAFLYGLAVDHDSEITALMMLNYMRELDS